MTKLADKKRAEEALTSRKALSKGARIKIAEVFRSWRSGAKLSRKDAAKKIGVTEQTIETWESLTAPSRPKVARVAQVERALGQKKDAFYDVILHLLDNPPSEPLITKAKRVRPGKTKAKRAPARATPVRRVAKEPVANGALAVELRVEGGARFVGRLTADKILALGGDIQSTT